MSSGLYSTEKRDFDTTLDLTKLRPYGDTMNDGKVQMSFTLPVPCNEKGVEAALELARKMGFVNPAVAFSEALDKEFSFYVVYGATSYNMKGYAGHYGLERYKGVRAYNLGSQVPNEEFIKKAIELKADALLVSQTVTQKDVHIENLTNLVELLEAEGLRDKIILIAGGARITNDLAKELGYDAGFGPGKYADDVATFVLKEMVQRGMNTKK